MYLVFKYICKKYLVFKYILSTYLVFKYILSMYLVFKYKKVFSAQLWLATSRSNGKSWTEAARPLFPCQTSGLAATQLQRFISGQTARVTWQKRPGRQRLKNARLTGPLLSTGGGATICRHYAYSISFMFFCFSLINLCLMLLMVTRSKLVHSKIN